MSVQYVSASSEFSVITTTLNQTHFEGARVWTTATGLYITAYPAVGATLLSLSNTGAAPISFEIQLDPSGVLKVVFDNAGSVGTGTGTTALALTTTYHIATVFNGGGATDAEKWRLYINGAEETLTFVGAAPVEFISAGTNGGITVGVRSGGAFGWLDGFVDEIRMWALPLSPQDIANDMIRAIPDHAQYLKVWAPFSGNTDTTVYTPLAGVVTHVTASANGGPLRTNTVFNAPTSINHHPSRRWRTRRSFTQKNVPFYPLTHRGM